MPSTTGSERRIIAFNNALFTAAAEELDRLTPDAPIRMAEAYGDVAQQCRPDKGNDGYVQIRFFDENDKEDDWETLMLDELCEQVRTLHEAGLPYGEMAILLLTVGMPTPSSVILPNASVTGSNWYRTRLSSCPVH